MVRHHGAASTGRQPREMSSAASFLAPIVIFSIALFALYQVNHHTQLETMIQENQELHKDDHFATGGRKAQETGQRDIHLSDSDSSVKDSDSVITTAPTTTAASQTLSTGEQVPGVCHAVENAEFHGQVVQWGDGNIKQTAGECCEACRQKAGCNVWVWCAASSCGGGSNPRPHGECWLKKAQLDTVLDQAGKAHPGTPWTSGALYSDAEYKTWQDKIKAKEKTEQDRLKALRDREDLPLIWLEVTLKGQKLGRMEFVLFTDISPLAAENMRRMCTGEVSPKHTLKGAAFYRIIDQFIDQTGVEVNPCALGGMFKDDPEGLKLKHDRKGLLSVANMGHNTNTGHFSILMGPAPHLNGGYVIFGEMVSGWEVAVAVNKLSYGRPNNEMLNSPDAVISDVGQIRRGKPVPEEVIKAGLVNVK